MHDSDLNACLGAVRSGLADNVTTSRPGNVCQIRSLFTLRMLRVYGPAGHAFGTCGSCAGSGPAGWILRPGALTAADRAATGQSDCALCGRERAPGPGRLTVIRPPCAEISK
jgi:hypothetical protein